MPNITAIYSIIKNFLIQEEMLKTARIELMIQLFCSLLGRKMVRKVPCELLFGEKE